MHERNLWCSASRHWLRCGGDIVVHRLQLIPLEELKRPRVDVVVNCSGVFRDLFVNQMNLLDRAVKLAAEQDEPDEMNFVRKHAREQVRVGLDMVGIV